jgi:phosphate starvation-inducible membrane PsiE
MHLKEFRVIEKVGTYLVEGFHLLALFAIGATVVWAAAYDFMGMVERGHATLGDILLLFLYLEIGAMVGIYFQTNRLPVRFLLYIAVTALTRVLTIDSKDMNTEMVLTTSSAILILAFAIYLLRFGCREPEEDAGTQVSVPRHE